MALRTPEEGLWISKDQPTPSPRSVQDAIGAGFDGDPPQGNAVKNCWPRTKLTGEAGTRFEEPRIALMGTDKPH